MKLPKVIEFRLKDDVSREGLERLRVQVQDLIDEVTANEKQSVAVDDTLAREIDKVASLHALVPIRVTWLEEAAKSEREDIDDLRDRIIKLERAASWITHYDKATLRIEKLETQMRKLTKAPVVTKKRAPK